MAKETKLTAEEKLFADAAETARANHEADVKRNKVTATKEADRAYPDPTGKKKTEDKETK